MAKLRMAHASTHGARKHAWRTQAAWAKRRRKKRKKKERGEREKLNDGNNNGQAMHGARKHAWRMQAAWAKNEID